LYATLIEPFAKELAGRTRLLIAPVGPLNALAFDALVASPAVRGSANSSYHAATYLLDSFEIEYLPSPAFLQSRKERSRGQRVAAARLLAVGYDAPGSEVEIRALRDVWPRQRLTTIESFAATESAVKSRMRNFGVVHFAVHATADTRDPLASHLRLVADSIDDGFFHVNEIDGKRVDRDLVVLSACETNAGPIYSGEGVMGIARAFLASGARAVVGTQWPIGAETAVLMREFYARLARGEPPAAALRAAKLLVRRSPDTAHPFHWAGFVLVR
jgi:CHAT domain-containing protein